MENQQKICGICHNDVTQDGVQFSQESVITPMRIGRSITIQDHPHCGHKLHKKCLEELLQRTQEEPKCPSCQGKITCITLPSAQGTPRVFDDLVLIPLLATSYAHFILALCDRLSGNTGQEQHGSRVFASFSAASATLATTRIINRLRSNAEPVRETALTESERRIHHWNQRLLAAYIIQAVVAAIIYRQIA